MKDLIQNFKHIRFIGAGGIGMSALIAVLEDQQKLGFVDQNIRISKSDSAWSDSPLLEEHNEKLLGKQEPAELSEEEEYMELRSSKSAEKNLAEAGALDARENQRTLVIEKSELRINPEIVNTDDRNTDDEYLKAITKSNGVVKVNDPFTEDIDLAVVSTAIPSNHEELAALKRKTTPIWHRSDMLLALSQLQGQKNIVVSGTHGKTTCSAMVSHILMDCGEDPSFVVGGILKDYETNGRAGKGNYFVLEGDESDKSFMKTYPHIALLTSMEPDHLENYPGGFDEIRECFEQFLKSAHYVVLCLDDPNLKAFYEELGVQDLQGEKLQDASKETEKVVWTYSSTDNTADFYLDQKSKTLFFKKNGAHDTYGKLELSNFGNYNYLNALGSIAVAYLSDLKIEDAISAMKNFQGIKRRLEFISDYTVRTPGTNLGAKITVYDDYAHHPTELRALVDSALNEVKNNPELKRLFLIYQPHHPRRTQDLWDEFIEVFKTFPEGHRAYLTDIYVARTDHIEGINSKRMVEEVANPSLEYLSFPNARFDSDDTALIEEMKAKIEPELRDGDLLLIVGAGNITKLASSFAQ